MPHGMKELLTSRREGERALGFDPAEVDGDARVVFIGTIRSPWRSREDCPKNMREARERGRKATVEIAEPYRAGGSTGWSGRATW